EILFVDDDVKVTEQVKDLLSDEFTVHTANNTSIALDYVKTKNIGLVISDYYMPEMKGIEFLSKILKTNPLIRRILISGQMDVNIALESIDVSKVHKILVKPFDPTELRQEISSQLKIYKSQMKIEQTIVDEEDVKSAFDLHCIQVNKLNNILSPIWGNDSQVHYSPILTNVIRSILTISESLFDYYTQDPNINFEALEYFSSNMIDLELIAEEFNQLNLKLYAMLVNTCLALITNNIATAKKHLNDCISFSQSVSSLLDVQLLKNKEELTSIVNTMILTKIMTDDTFKGEISSKIKQFLKINIRALIEFNEEMLKSVIKDHTKFYCTMILKDDSAVFFKTSLPTIDITDLYKTLDTIKSISSNISQTYEKSQSIEFNAGSIVTQQIEKVKYILLFSKNTLEARVKFRKFIINSLDLVKTIPILTIPNEDDSKYLNELAVELFNF
ncbi:MAG: response regulator, partial [Candidatus Kariarchaeaceae archaeon]